MADAEVFVRRLRPPILSAFDVRVFAARKNHRHAKEGLPVHGWAGSATDYDAGCGIEHFQNHIVHGLRLNLMLKIPGENPSAPSKKPRPCLACAGQWWSRQKAARREAPFLVFGRP